MQQKLKIKIKYFFFIIILPFTIFKIFRTKIISAMHSNHITIIKMIIIMQTIIITFQKMYNSMQMNSYDIFIFFIRWLCKLLV
jgi:hypothetical protein